MRLRKKIFGSAEKPRLSVHKSHQNLFAQLIDDINAKTLYSLTTRDKAFTKENSPKANNTQKAKMLGQVFAKKAIEHGIKEVVFDRGGFQYHGRIKAFAESARENGLKF